MIKIDLHVHSKYSDYQKNGFIQRLGVAESYSEPEELYQVLLKQGMNFITLTDHDRIEGVLQLQKKHPENVIMGVETTATFPEDGCQIHILIYDFNEDQFKEIQRNRFNIYHLRDYLRWAHLPHAIAHPTYSADGKLKIEHLEKLLLLFDTFECFDNWQSALHNNTWIQLLNSLTPGSMDELERQYQIEPFSTTSWQKGRIGGSNDHSGLYLASAYTTAEGESIQDFMNCILAKQTQVMGLSGDFRSHVLSTYEVSWEFTKKKGGVLSQIIIQHMNEQVFNNRTIEIWKKYKLHRYVTKLKKEEIEFQISLLEMGNSIDQGVPSTGLKSLIPFDKMSEMVDLFFSLLLKSIDKDIKRGKLLNLIRNLSMAIPGILVITPFFYSVFQLFKDNKLLYEFRNRFGLEKEEKKRKILWFSDTIFDLNGVAVILRNILGYAFSNNYPIYVVGCCDMQRPEFTNLITLPTIHNFHLPYYKSYTLHVPSIIRSLEIIVNEQPDEIIISTPGPVGLIGWLAARLLNIKCTGIYHTDYAAQTRLINKESLVVNLIEELSLKFYSQMDEILVPSQVYIDMLTSQGYHTDKLKLLPSGINTKVFAPHQRARQFLLDEYMVNDGIFILFTGRISKDKNIDVLLSSFEDLAREHPDITLFVVGDGPYRKTAKRKYDRERIIYTGMIPYDDLPNYYAGCDLFVFPSTTDTYGLSVMEAQSCGLPAIVSNIGGPQEIIVDGVTGYIIPDLNVHSWKAKMSELIDQIRNHSPEYMKMKEMAREHIINTSSWEMFFETLLK
jgi:glycosyltransferase involved in cell wall biosynthesis